MREHGPKMTSRSHPRMHIMVMTNTTKVSVIGNVVALALSAQVP